MTRRKRRHPARFRDALHLLDENVLREAGSRGNANVRRWLATIDDSCLRLSAATLFEKRWAKTPCDGASVAKP